MRVIMNCIVVAAIAACIFILSSTASVMAGVSCKKNYIYDGVNCVKRVQQEIASQDSAAADGPQWPGPTRESCNRASKQQEGNARRCRSYDYQEAKAEGDGKTLEQCAKCCRQLREDMRRWKQCAAAGFAPPFPSRLASKWKKELGCTF